MTSSGGRTPITIRQEPVGGDVDAVGTQLDAAFAEMKRAVEAGEPVVVLVSDADLLGQGDPCDAAVACALLGMTRTLSIEGVKHGWQLNVVSHRDGAGPVEEVRDGLAAIPGLTGQLIRVGTDHLGKVLP